MASITEPRAEEMIQQTLDKYQPGQRRTILLKQILKSMMNGMSDNKKKAIMRANAMVLKYNLDQNDKIPLFKVAFK
jgi:cytochrome c551/c552